MSERFWSKVRKSDGCWEWTAGTFRQTIGYGAFKVREGGRWVRRGAHRVAWALTFGPVPVGMFVLHKCDNPRCVRPEHLFLGTHAENMADRTRKGRQVGGEDHWAARMTAADVLRARALVAGGMTIRDAARDLGKHESAVGNAVNGKTWKHLNKEQHR